MEPTDRTALHRALAFWALFLAAGVQAQDAVMSLPTSERTVGVLRDTGPQSKSKPATPTGAFFAFGPVSLHPHLLVRTLYGMGLPARGGRHVASMIYTTAPGLGVDLGSQWTLDYTPSWTSYTARALEDTLSHSARLQGAGKFQEWTVTFAEAFSAASPLLFETGEQTDQTTWGTQLGASRGFGSGLNFATTASLNESYLETAPDTRDWATMNWLTLRFAPRLETGLGLGAGYTDIVGQPDATNERYMGRLNWNPTDKLNLAVDGGVEVRHSRAAAARDMRNPIINASLTYQPFEVTQLSLTNSRTVATSYFQNQVTQNATWDYSLEQRLLGRLFLTAKYTHSTIDYDAVVNVSAPADPADPAGPVLVSPPGRSDRIDSINLRLSTTLLRRWMVTASYLRSDNRSSLPGFTFITTQFGLEVSCRY